MSKYIDMCERIFSMEFCKHGVVWPSSVISLHDTVWPFTQVPPPTDKVPRGTYFISFTQHLKVNVNTICIHFITAHVLTHAWYIRGCFIKVSRALQIFSGNLYIVKIVLLMRNWAHVQRFQLEILSINVISGIVYFREIILESSRNVSEINPRTTNHQQKNCINFSTWICT